MKYIIDTDKLPCNNGQNCTSCPFWGFEEGPCSINEQVKRLPVYEERPHGEWIEHKWAEEFDGHLISNYECSCCHSWKRENTDFCPNCGADMRKEG